MDDAANDAAHDAAKRADEEGRADVDRLLRDIATAPYAHDFFAVLRLVEGRRPDLPRWGRAARPAHEALRLSQDAELDFAPAAVSSLDLDARAAPRLGVRFFGLFGSHGPMPLHFTEHVRERSRVHGDPTTARFLDVFHHRLLSFFYRAWAQAQPTTHLDRPGDARYSAWLGAGFGFDDRASAARALPASAELAQAGLLGSRSRHPEGLRKVLAGYFRAPVAVEEHVPHVLALGEGERSRLGFSHRRRERVGAPPPALGGSAVAGSKVYDRQSTFRVVLGPLSLAQYESLVPGGDGWGALREWIDHYAGLDLRWEIRLVLAEREVPPPRLARGVRLGITTWIAGAGGRDRGDLRLVRRSSFTSPAAHA